MSHSHSHRFLFLITCLAAFGFLSMTPSGVDAEVKRPPSVKQQVANARDNCESLGGSFTVRGAADRAITECQYPDGDYSTCLLTPTNTECHLLEVDVRPGDEGDQLPVDLPDDTIQNGFTPPREFRQLLA